MQTMSAHRTPVAKAARAFTALRPTTVGPLTIAPLVANAPPGLRYITLSRAMARGVVVDEDGVGDVGNVVVDNPLGLPVLLYDGEELAGAKQDRIVNVSALLPARSRRRVPVSCVEAGRWHRESPRFRSSGNAAAPSLRRAKAQALRGAPLARGRAQARVWSDVDALSARLGARSATRAYSAVANAVRPNAESLSRRFRLVPGQCGALVAVGGRPLCMDAVSSADAFADLWPRLLSGYAVAAAGATAGGQVRRRDLVAMLRRIDAVPLTVSPSVGLGSDVRGGRPGLEVTGLVHDGAIVQLSAYAD